MGRCCFSGFREASDVQMFRGLRWLPLRSLQKIGAKQLDEERRKQIHAVSNSFNVREHGFHSGQQHPLLSWVPLLWVRQCRSVEDRTHDSALASSHQGEVIIWPSASFRGTDDNNHFVQGKPTVFPVGGQGHDVWASEPRTCQLREPCPRNMPRHETWRCDSSHFTHMRYLSLFAPPVDTQRLVLGHSQPSRNKVGQNHAPASLS